MTTPADSAEFVDPDTDRESTTAAANEVESAVPHDAVGRADGSATRIDGSGANDRPVVAEVRTDGSATAAPNPAGAPSRAGAREVAAAICPYLASVGGSWRMATPSRDHRCIGIA